MKILLVKNQDKVIRQLLIHLSTSLKIAIDVDYEILLVKNALSKGKKPHTFRVGKKGKWKEILSKDQKKWFLTEMKDILINLEYEKK